MDAYSTHDAEALLRGFEACGGWFDRDIFALEAVAGMGIGAIAKRDIPEGCPLFRIPYTCILSQFTSQLRDHLPLEIWNSLDGWSKLILVLMWESGRQGDSPWKWYLDSMPNKFHTPMFWSDEDKQSLIGTEIEKRIGKDEAEELYDGTILPVIQAHPDVFVHDKRFYTVEAFHIQGSRILSRSFTIPLEVASAGIEGLDQASHASSSDSGEDETSIIAMIPIADALNASSGLNNARLFNMDEVDNKVENVTPSYTMSSVTSIKADTQIYNTYSELPNSELLRKYGHVDENELDGAITDRLIELGILQSWSKGNTLDEVALDGDRIVLLASRHLSGNAELSDRIDWWLEEGQDDSFTISLVEGVDPAFFSFAHLLLDDSIWRKAKKRSRLPEPRQDERTLLLLKEAIDDRLSRYRTDMEHDLQDVQTESSQYKRAGLIVRIGERRSLYLARPIESHITTDSSDNHRAAEDRDIKRRRFEPYIPRLNTPMQGSVQLDALAVER